MIKNPPAGRSELCRFKKWFKTLKNLYFLVKKKCDWQRKPCFFTLLTHIKKVITLFVFSRCSHEKRLLPVAICRNRELLMTRVWKKNKSQAALFKKIIYYRNKNLKKITYTHYKIILFSLFSTMFVLCWTVCLQHNRNKSIWGHSLWRISRSDVWSFGLGLPAPPFPCYIKKKWQTK